MYLMAKFCYTIYYGVNLALERESAIYNFILYGKQIRTYIECA